MEAYQCHSKDKVSHLISCLVNTKLSLAVQYASNASIYDAVTTASEFSSPQCIVLALLYSLVNNDVALCSLLGTVSSTVQQLRSSYLKVWLKEDFRFNQEEIYKAFHNLSQFIDEELIDVPIHVLQILTSIAEQYSVVVKCKANGNLETLEMLKYLGVDIPDDSSSNLMEKVVENDESIGKKRHVLLKIDPSPVQASSNTSVQPSTSSAPINEPTSSISETLNDVNIELTFNDSSSQPSDHSEPYFFGSEDEAEWETGSGDSFFYSENLIEEQRELITFTEQFTPIIRASDGKSNTLLHKAAECGNIRVIKALIDAGVEVDVEDIWNRTPAMVAVEKGQFGALQALYLWHDANLFAVDNRSDSMLHYAAANGHNEIVKWLAAQAVDVNKRGRGGWRPLHRATLDGNIYTIELLIELGAFTDGRCNAGSTPLFRAVCKNMLQVVQFLILNSASVNISTNNGESPLHVAVKNGNLEMVNLLIHHGANPCVRDSQNKSPLDWARIKKRKNIIQTLRNTSPF